MKQSPTADSRDLVLNELLLMIEDDPLAVELAKEALADLPVRVVTAANAARGLEAFSQLKPHLVLLDLHLPDQYGLDTLARILEIDPGANVILVTAEYSTEAAVEAIRRGAIDYITKPFPIEQFQKRISRWLSAPDRHGRNASPLSPFRWHGMIGRAPGMRELFSRIERVAPHYRTALVTGETGTGKELAARAVHDNSPVAHGPYITCNCASFADSLFESEVFGYVKGAFTGAMQDRPGLIAAAHGGTIFLDEVGELPLGAQAKLLRVLQSREVRPVGSTKSQPVDIRVIAATNRNLREMVAAKTFREDLYYRLAMLELPVPALRGRSEDIPLLARHFIRSCAEQYRKPHLQLELRALMALTRYPWPGNVRELENVLGAAALMADSDTIDLRHLPLDLGTGARATAGNALPTMAELNQQHVRFVLRELRGNRRQAALVLGISRATLYRLLREMGEPINGDPSSADSRWSLTSVSATE